MSLLTAAERFASIDRSEINFDPGRCLYTKGKSAACRACFDLCPVAAITPGKPPRFEAGRCQACLACLPVCPTGAFGADDSVPALFNAASHVEGEALELLCEHNPQPERGLAAETTGIMVRHCLGGLGMGAYVALAAFGLKRIYVRTEHCAGCSWSVLGASVEAQARQANQFLSAWDKPAFVECLVASDDSVARTFWSAENPPVSRREMFRMLARRSKTIMARAIENGQSRQAGQPGRDRLRLLGALANLPLAEARMDTDLVGLGFASLSVSDACSACATCARVCPTGALSYDRDAQGAHFSLHFAASNCVACGLCAHACIPSAIDLDYAPSFSQVFSEPVVTVFEASLVKCSRCGAATRARPGFDLCPVCEFRRQNPFGSMLPQDMAARMASPYSKERVS